MKSRYTEIMNLAEDTYNQYKYYGEILTEPTLACLKSQREFAENDWLLSDEEKGDIDLYITSYITKLYYDKASSK